MAKITNSGTGPDNEQLRRDAEQAVGIFEDIGKFAESSAEQIARYFNALLDIRQAYLNGVDNLEKEETDGNRRKLEEMYGDYKTCRQRFVDLEEKRRQDIQKFYNEPVEWDPDGNFDSSEHTFREGATQGNVDNANCAYQASVEKLAMLMAEKEAAFAEWMRNLKGMSLEQARAAIEKAKQAIAFARENGVSEANLSGLQKKVDEGEKALGGKEVEKSKEEWDKLYKVFEGVGKEFEKSGDQIDGTAGKAIKAAGTITIAASQGIGAISKLANWASASAKMAAEGATASMIAVEKASVILTVISAGLQVVSALTGLFGSNKEELRKAAEAAWKYDQALKDIAITARYDLFDIIFGENAIDKFGTARDISIQAIEDIRNQVDGAGNVGADFFQIPGDIEAVFDGRSGWNKLVRSGDHKVKTYVFDINKYVNGDGSMSKEQLEALKAWYDAYADGLDKSERKYLENLINNGEHYVEAIGIQKQHLQDLFGSLADDIASNMIDAFLATGDAAENLGDVVDDVARKMANDIISNLIFDKVLNGLEDDVWSLISNGDYSGAANMIKGAVDGISEMTPELIAGMESVGLIAAGSGQAARTSAAQGFAQASQDSIDGLFGVVANIENNTFGIHEMMKIQQANTNVMLGHLSAIHHNTDRLEQIEGHLLSANNRLSDVVDSVNQLNGR